VPTSASRRAAKAVIVEGVDRLHWRLWNRKARNARVSIDRIRAVMHHFKDEAGTRKPISRSRKLWTASHALDGNLIGQTDWLGNYAERYRVGTANLSGFGQRFQPANDHSFQPTPVDIVSLPVASSRFASWRLPDPEAERVH
jgi:hypothetical protein